MLFEYEGYGDYWPSDYYGTIYNYGNNLISHYKYTDGNGTDYILYASDAHGDNVRLYDTSTATLAPVATNYYDSFGNGGANEYSRLGYAGEYHDAETGFIYLRARYYDPAIGRFISEDQHWNLDNMVYGDEPKALNEAQTYAPDYDAII